MFHLDKHLQEGAYFGCGQDGFADSWIVFDSAQGNGKVLLAVESKQRSKPEPLTVKYFNHHKTKVKKKLGQTSFVFVMVADMLGDNIEAGENEITITQEIWIRCMGGGLHDAAVCYFDYTPEMLLISWLKQAASIFVLAKY